MKRTHASPFQLRKWSDLGHVAFIDALTSTAPLTADQLAFHGGTSLHLSWKSPRFSEDLDFLLARGSAKKIKTIMPKVLRRLKETLHGEDPDLKVEIRDKTREGSRLLNFLVVIEHPHFIGNVKVKAEFWQVEEDYLKAYETKFTYPSSAGDMISRVTQPLPAATLSSAYADKITAFATRPHLKWRDIYDLWWIGSQIKIDVPRMADRFLHHVKGYNTVEGLPPAGALRHFLKRSDEEMISVADPDIRKWLPPDHWNRLEGSGVEQMVKEVRRALTVIAEAVEDKGMVNGKDDADERIEP